jgi:hypothetical protein
VEPSHDAEPRLLDHVVGDRVGRDVHPGDAAHRGPELVDEHHERRFVTRAEQLDEGAIVARGSRGGHRAGA